MNLPHAIDRTVLIRARRATVFSFFTDSARFASWWGKGSTIDGRPGGAVRICYPDGTVASGNVVEIEKQSRIVFSYGYEGEGKPIAPGGSRVTITLRDDPLGTLLVFRHDLADAAVRDQHVQGWRYQLSVFAAVASAAQHCGADSGAERAVDAWFAAWSETDASKRRELLAGCCAADVAFRDGWSALRGVDDLVPHIGGAQQFMPGIALLRTGPLRHCQGTLLVDWALRNGAQTIASGTNVFELLPDGRIQSAVGIAAPPPAAR
jgi:uncharacterized protein YndB with AHSA1/START domain